MITTADLSKNLQYHKKKYLDTLTEREKMHSQQNQHYTIIQHHQGKK